jgi:hypothetical protein
MHVTTRLHWLPKAGNQREEYEDAAWPARAVRAAGSEFRCAVADGATESAFAGQWARQLVRWYNTSPVDARRLHEQLAAEQQHWRAEIQRTPLPWYAEAKALQGAYAALLGLRLHTPAAGEGTWEALAVGDCCLAHLRRDAVLATFPATDAAFFGSRPYLISSHPARNGELTEQTQSAAGTWLPGDRFWLMTDALAHWLLAGLAGDDAPVAQLHAEATGSRRAFARWIAGLRHAGALRNDDVTLLVVTVDA